MGQLSYAVNLNPFNVGTVGYSNDWTSFSYANPNSQLYPGIGVVQLASDGQCDLPSSGNVHFVGVVMKDRNQAAVTLPTGPNSNTQISTFYPVNSLVAVMTRGQIQAQLYAAVTTISPVYVIKDSVAQKSTLVFSADLVASNVVNGSVTFTTTTVSGGITTVVTDTNAIAPETFDTNNATTLTNIATAIAALDGVTSAVSDGTHTITVTGDLDTVLSFSGWLVTLGASQATVAITETVAAVYDWQIGWFNGAALGAGGAATFQVTPGCRWVASSGTDPVGNLVAMLDINIPGVAT